MQHCLRVEVKRIGSKFRKTLTRGLFSTPSNFLRVLFFGTDEFSLGTLDALNGLRSKGTLITHLDVIPSGKIHRQGKKIYIPPVIDYATKHDLNALSWEQVKKEGRFDDQYDLGVVASFGDFIPGRILSLFPRGSINVHPSLLPRWRGPAPIIHTVLAGDLVTGITVQEVSKKKFDVGKILYQREYAVPEDCTSDELLEYLARESGLLIPHVIENLDELQKNATVQSEELATHAPKVAKVTGYINFAKHSSSYIKRLQRALPTTLGIRVCWEGKEVILGKIDHIQEDSVSTANLPLGGCWYDKPNKSLWIKVVDGCLVIHTLRIVSKKKSIPVHAFYNEYLDDKKTGLPGNSKFENMSVCPV